MSVVFTTVDLTVLLLTYVFADVFINSLLVGTNTKRIRPEGTKNEIFECSFSDNRAPVWRINDSLYEPFSLPSPLEPTLDGLIISVIERSYNNTRFQCLALDGNGLKMVADGVTTLIVTKNSKTLFEQSLIEQSLYPKLT